MPALDLDRDAEQVALELKARGLAIVSLPAGALDEVVAIFKHISEDALVDEGECMNFEPLESSLRWPRLCRRFLLPHLPVEQLRFFVGNQTSKTSKDQEEEEFMRYANAARPETLTKLAEPIASLLQPVTRLFFGAQERVITVNAQYIFGNAKSNTEVHRDFLSRNTISLLTPLFDYSPEEASLHFWRFDENPDFYATAELESAAVRRTYSYKRGEAVLFSGDLFHQTVPFRIPEAGWGFRQCRALFCLVLVAADALQREDDYKHVLKCLKGPAGGYMVDPATEEFLSDSSSDTESCSSCVDSDTEGRARERRGLACC